MSNENFSYRPLYLQLREVILKKIIDEEFTKDNPLPSEAALAKSFGTSISTVRQALASLVAEDILVKKQGKGTFLSNKKKKIRFFSWLPETQRGEEILHELITRFEAKETNIEIEVIPTTYPEARNDLMGLIASGNAPDVAQIVSHWTSFFASSGSFASLDNLLPQSHLSSRFKDKDLYGGTYSNSIYSVAWGLTPLSMIVNKRLVEKAGINNIPEKISMEQFYSYCQAIDSRFQNDGISSFGMCISDEETDFLRVYPFFKAFGGELVSTGNELVLNSEENVAAFKWLRKFVNDCRVSRADIFTLRKQMAMDKIAFFNDGPWIKFWLEELTGEPFDKRFRVIQNPVLKDGVSRSWNYNHALAICSQSPNKIFAAKFVDAISFDPEISGFYYRQSGHLPVNIDRKGIYESSDDFTRVYENQLEGSSCINSQNALFEKVMIFCIDAVRKILFEGCDITKELNEKEYYLEMLYRD